MRWALSCPQVVIEVGLRVMTRIERGKAGRVSGLRISLHKFAASHARVNTFYGDLTQETVVWNLTLQIG